MSIFDRLFFQNAASGDRKRQIARMLAQLTENERDDRAHSPQDGVRWQPFLPLLQEKIEEYESIEEGAPVDASVQTFLTEDRMYAYACLLPPLDGGAELQLYALGKELESQGISIDLEENALSYVMKRQYLHVFCVARGTPPQDGADGQVEELFSHRPVYSIDVRDGDTADFQETRPVQLVQRGEPVFRIRPATPGVEGMDVTGRKLPCRPGAPVKIPTGLNLECSADGLRVEATESGAVFDRDGNLYVQTAIVRLGTLQKDDNLVWLAYIDGDIPKGIRVVSTSNILVMGEIRGAEVVSRGSVRAQRGIWEGSRIEAKGQVLAPVIENSHVKAGRDILAEEIRDSDVTCDGSVLVKGGKGLIQGGIVRASEGIESIQIGTPDGGRNEFVLGCTEDLTQEIRRLSEELEASRNALEKLRRNIKNLRSGGSTLSPEKRMLLTRLTKERDLYEQEMEEMTVHLKETRERRLIERDKQLLFQKMYPLTVVKIGGATGEFSRPMEASRVRVYSGVVVAT